MSLQTTTAQTVGPFFHIGLASLFNAEIAGPGVEGERVMVEGRVLDGDRQPVNDALIEIWQANAQGKYTHPDDCQNRPVEPGFKGFARIATDDQGGFRLSTIKPGCVPGPDGELQAPHLLVSVFMRGLLPHLVTRMYFPNDAANAEDPVLKRVPPERRATLIATKRGAQTLEWNVILQGDGETVFFDY